MLDVHFALGLSRDDRRGSTLDQPGADGVEHGFPSFFGRTGKMSQAALFCAGGGAVNRGGSAKLHSGISGFSV